MGVVKLGCRWLIGFSVVVLACRQPAANGHADDPTATSSQSADTGAATQTGVEDLSTRSWFEAVRMQRYREAAIAFDESEGPSPAPELRYVRAKIALEIEDYPRVVSSLNELEQTLPEFSSEIALLRAHARSELGPFEEAAEFFASRSDGGSALRSARAFAKASKPDRALEVLAKALSRLGDGRASQRAELLRLQAEILESQGKKNEAVDAYKKLTIDLPTENAARDADLAYERLSTKRLTKKQRYARAEAFTSAGDIDAALHELDLMDGATGEPPPGVVVLRTQAWAYYKSRRDYDKAAQLFAQTAKLDPTFRTQDLFFSARALSRANKDELAIERYLALASQNPKSNYAEQARYFAARLYFYLGRFREALLAYNDYQRRYAKGRYLDAVRLERALSRLALGDGKGAQSDLERAIGKSEDVRERLHLRELLGLALQLAGKPDAAASEWQQVIDERPLSLAALLSAARLRAMGREPPPPIDEVERVADDSVPPPVIHWPRKAQKLFIWGLHEDAARELYDGRSAFQEAHAPRGEEALCDALGLLATAELRFGYAHRVVPERVLMRGVTQETRWQWDCIFPRPYAGTVAIGEETNQLPPGLAYAIMRQESAFKPRVRSPVGAVGLMQLMPRTAEKAAEETSTDYDAELLISPPYNIRLGTYYLGKVLQTFDGNPALAAAAYNAGPGAVRRWVEGSETLPLDLWIARIPYDETRGYVRRVIANWARYRYLEGGAQAVPTLSLDLPKLSAPEAPEY